MKGIIKLVFLILVLMPIDSFGQECTAHSTCGSKEVCVITGTSPDGSASGICKTCPETFPSANHESAEFSYNACYKTCTGQIDNSNPYSFESYYNSLHPEREACDLFHHSNEVTCNNNTDIEGFHLVVDSVSHTVSCVKNKQECSASGCKDKHSFQIWKSVLTGKADSTGYTDCFCEKDNCSESFFGELTGTENNSIDDAFVVCFEANKPCSNLYDRYIVPASLSACKNEKNITGNFSDNGQNRFSDCRCISNIKGSDEKGHGTKHCKLEHVIDGTESYKNGKKPCDGTSSIANQSYCYRWNCEDFEIKNYDYCQEGHCDLSKNCDLAEKNSYGTGKQNDTDCHKCPQGSMTSDTGAKAATDCFYNNQTQFCDSNGCFTLPIGEIHYSTGE